ncbi:MAG TPA: response regulator transcription factor [Pirellulales bacterium]|nr:response regulator transcription factor [Pirellulales bacterium]
MAKRPIRRKPAQSGSAKCTVMLADDQSLVAEGMATLIASFDQCQVSLVTSDAMQLLAAAERSPPSLVVMDAAMAQSFRAARALATRCPRTKVILLDEFRLDTHLQRAMDCGAAGYVTKCDASTDLRAAVSKVLAGGHSFPDLMPLPMADCISSNSKSGGAAHALPLLTRRELEVLSHLAEGLKVREIAKALGISPNTVENHKAHVMRKLGLHKNVELARFAVRHGLVADA